jgi:putative MFS transporter
VGRTGGILAPMVVGAILVRWPGRQDLVFFQFALVILVGLISVAVLGKETRGLGLEEIAG